MWRAQYAPRAHAVCCMRAQYPHALIRQPDKAAPAVVEVQQVVVCGRMRAKHDERARIPARETRAATDRGAGELSVHESCA